MQFHTHQNPAVMVSFKRDLCVFFTLSCNHMQEILLLWCSAEGLLGISDYSPQMHVGIIRYSPQMTVGITHLESVGLG